MFKGRKSTKVFLSFIGLVALIYFGWQGYALSQLSNFKYESIQPGHINLIAVRPGLGYRILVANSIAQLADVPQGAFGASEQDYQDDAQATNKRLIPIREMLKSLQGDVAALSKITMKMNEINEDDLPPEPIIWTKEDVEKAIGGDAALKKKLESDINVTLDGQPLPVVRESALENGIVLDFPVPIKVRVGSEEKVLLARVKESFRPGFIQRVFARYSERPNITEAVIRASYIEEANELKDNPTRVENIAKNLQGRWSESRVQELGAAPSRLLGSTEVVLNESYISGAKVVSEEMSGGRMVHNLLIRLTESGRLRLWKYSRSNPRFQLMFVVNGVAIAAPRISGELSSNEVRISQLTDERLVRNAVGEVEKRSVKKAENRNEGQ